MSAGRTFAWALIAVVIATIVAMYLINPFGTASRDPGARIIGVKVYRMPSVSMEPTVHAGEYFIVNVATLANRDPEVGEIVIFKFPPNPAVDMIRRVVATGGKTFEMRTGVVYLDGQRLAEPWLPAEPITTVEINGQVMELNPEDIRADFAPVVVPQGHFLVLGDNRGNSLDSRQWGFVPRESMIGTYVRALD